MFTFRQNRFWSVRNCVFYIVTAKWDDNIGVLNLRCVRRTMTWKIHLLLPRPFLIDFTPREEFVISWLPAVQRPSLPWHFPHTQFSSFRNERKWKNNSRSTLLLSRSLAVSRLSENSSHVSCLFIFIHSQEWNANDEIYSLLWGK